MIVAAFQLHAAAAVVVSEDVPLPGGTAALTRALGIEPTPDRGRFLYEMTRLLYDAPEGRKAAAEAFLQMVRQPPGRDRSARASAERRRSSGDDAAEFVPIPLTVDLWSSAIFHRKVAPREIVLAILADRAAALLCLGLSMLDDATLEYVAERPSLLDRIYERSAPAFVAFAGSLHVQNNRLSPAGGDAAVSLWESLVPEKMTRPDRFMLQLLDVGEGRFAYLYGVVGQDAAVRPRLLRSVHGADAPAGGSGRRAVAARVARILVARLQRNRCAGGSCAAAAQRRRGSD